MFSAIAGRIRKYIYVEKKKRTSYAAKTKELADRIKDTNRINDSARVNNNSV